MRHFAILCVAAFAASAAACSDPILGTATVETSLDSLKVFALTGTPLSAPSALNITGRSVLRAATSTVGSVNFDIVFDVNSAGKILLYPAKTVAADANRTVGLLKSDTPFNDITEAPVGGYQFDSVTVANVGQAVVVNARSDLCAANPFLPNQYAKLVVDSVATASRLLFFRLVTDNNCGYRGLVPGDIPKR